MGPSAFRSLLFLALVGAISCLPLTKYGANTHIVTPDKILKANAFIDKLLKSKSGMLKEAIGRVKLPDQYFEFSKKIVMVETHGFAKLTHGRLDNLHDIKRKGDCLITTDGDALNLVLDLGVDNVKGGYYIEVEFGVFSAASNLKVNIESIELVIKGIQSFRAVSELDDPEDTNILNFDLALNVQANMGKVDIDVNIFGPMDWLFNLVAKRVIKSLKGSLQQMIKAPIRDAIQSITGVRFF